MNENNFNFEQVLFACMVEDNAKFQKENKRLKRRNAIFGLLAIPTIIRVSDAVASYIYKTFFSNKVNDLTIVEEPEEEL